MSLSKSSFVTFGEKKELAWFLNELFLKRDSINLIDLEKVFYSRFNSRYLEGILYLFQELDLIVFSKDYVKQNNKKVWSELSEDINSITPLIINRMKALNEHDQFFDKNFLFNEKNRLFFTGNSVPLEAAALRNLFISLDFFIPTSTIGLYEVNKDHIELIENIPLIDMGRRFTQSALEKELVKKEENFKKAGNEAELFVLRFEQEKYKHLDASITKGIERISQDYSRAGFDIISLKSDSSKFPDKLIEVKSYEVNRYFYWTDNEINKAFEEKENYFIYLVDRGLMSNSDYSPIEIQNPAKAIFDDKKRNYLIQTSENLDYKIYSDGWKVEF